tara:strand:+ start:10099 stop:11259 length:1161 start_codon:yes stop_codon:yes gene_type:complete
MEKTMLDSTVVDEVPTYSKTRTAEVDREETITGKRGSKFDWKIGLMVVGALALAFLLIMAALGSDDEVVEETALEPLNIEAAASADDPAELDTSALGVRPPETTKTEVPTLDSETSEQAMTAAERRRAEYEKRVAERQALEDSMRRAPVLVTSNNGSAARQVASSVRGDGAPAVAAERTLNGLEKSLQGRAIRRIGASEQLNRNFTVEAGAQIPCVLQTALDSTLSGLVTCVVSNDIRSATGQVVLMEKGTRIIGEYQGGLRQGQARVFVAWNRAVTPQGVAMELASPAADSLGRTGITGDVETFFWKRFGGALLLSIVGDAGNAASNAVSGAREITNVPDDVASEALRGQGNISPVLRAPQGTNIVVLAAHDLDFSSVYSLRLRR